MTQYLSLSQSVKIQIRIYIRVRKMFLPDRDTIEYSRNMNAVFIVISYEIVVWDNSLEAERIFLLQKSNTHLSCKVQRILHTSV